MNVFKRKSIYLAVAAGLGAVGMVGTASAVNVNSNGTGEVLIYPYYSVRGGTDTYLSVVNTTNSAKAVKVRFTEGRNSREVLDFNLYLSARDVWAGAVVATTDGAKLITSDKSCTYPVIPATGQDFVNYAYAGSTVTPGIVDSGGDGAGSTLDRTREGYFEIIEMGVITSAAVVTAVTHTSAGVPANCAVVQTTAMTMDAAGTNPVVAPTGGLAGTASLLNGAAGTDFGYDPVALADFSTANIWFAAGDIRPDMRSALPTTSRVFKGGSVITTDWTGSTGNAAVNAVSAVLMHDNVINEYVLDTTTLSNTDWVVTMPTKRYYVPVVGNAEVAIAPFTQEFAATGACETVTLNYWDREEQTVTTTVDFSPPPPGAPASSLCWESTVVTFNAVTTGVSNVLGSTNSVNIPVNFENGWARIAFAQTYASLAAAGNSPAGAHTYVGLPVTGFMVQDFVNGNVGGVLSNYGGNFNHKFTTLINGSSAE
ncbi:MAG: hypothetical protein Q8P42_04040 [Gallionella sp.]|nr:hypothetical protein [Gallionella sp.]